jgi:hypothetical protein
MESRSDHLGQDVPVSAKVRRGLEARGELAEEAQHGGQVLGTVVRHGFLQEQGGLHRNNLGPVVKSATRRDKNVPGNELQSELLARGERLLKRVIYVGAIKKDVSYLHAIKKFGDTFMP